jgi:hypothetical protein
MISVTRETWMAFYQSNGSYKIQNLELSIFKKA